MTKRTVIYHANCLDGFTAAWAAWVKFGDADTEYVAANHGDPPPSVHGREVWVVDFSYPRDVLLRMNEAALSLAVLDHHKTARDALADLPFVTFDMERSGAGLTWDALHGCGTRNWLVSYVEDRDLWRFALLHSREINAWIGACRRDSFADWNKLHAIGPTAAADKGAAVLAYIDRYVHEMCAQARIVEVAGYRVPMVNAPYVCISELVGKLAESAPFAVGWFQRSDGLYAYSLRSRGPEGVDVSEIAKRYGGGGHRNSAGFALSERLAEQ